MCIRGGQHQTSFTQSGSPHWSKFTAIALPTQAVRCWTGSNSIIEWFLKTKFFLDIQLFEGASRVRIDFASRSHKTAFKSPFVHKQSSSTSQFYKVHQQRNVWDEPPEPHQTNLVLPIISDLQIHPHFHVAMAASKQSQQRSSPRRSNKKREGCQTYTKSVDRWKVWTRSVAWFRFVNPRTGIPENASVAETSTKTVGKFKVNASTQHTQKSTHRRSASWNTWQWRRGSPGDRLYTVHNSDTCKKQTRITACTICTLQWTVYDGPKAYR